MTPFSKHLRLTASCATVMAAFFISPLHAENIQVNTTNGTINGIGSGGTFNGTTFTTRTVNNTMVFTFEGDFVVNSNDRVIGTGTRAASFSAANNAIIGDNVEFEFSATGTQAGAGGVRGLA